MQLAALRECQLAASRHRLRPKPQRNASVAHSMTADEKIEELKTGIRISFPSFVYSRWTSHTRA